MHKTYLNISIKNNSENSYRTVYKDKRKNIETQLITYNKLFSKGTKTSLTSKINECKVNTYVNITENIKLTI